MASTNKASPLKPTSMPAYNKDGTYWVKSAEYREEFHLDIRKVNKDVCS